MLTQIFLQSLTFIFLRGLEQKIWGKGKEEESQRLKENECKYEVHKKVRR